MNDRMRLKIRRALVLGQEAEIPADVIQYLESFWTMYTNITGPNGNTPSDEAVALALWIREREMGDETVEEAVVEEPGIVKDEAVPSGRRPWSGRGRKPNWLKEREQEAGV